MILYSILAPYFSRLDPSLLAMSALEQPLNPQIPPYTQNEVDQHHSYYGQQAHNQSQQWKSSKSAISTETMQAAASHAPITRAEGRLQRRKQFYRAVYSEFFGTLIFFIPIYGVIANSIVEDWDETTKTLGIAISTGFYAIPIIFCFSSLSGAQFNPAITFALWLTKKQSTRKFLAFTLVQFIAPFLSLLIVWSNFPNVDHNVWEAIALKPVHNANRFNVFFTEMTMTFILTFIAFAMAFEESESIVQSSAKFDFLPALNPMDEEEDEDENNAVIVYSSTPQSKSGFTPFGIGFFLVAVILYKGSSSIGMNPARYLAPAVFANEWKYAEMYILGEYIGAMLASLLVVYGPQSSRRPNAVQEVPSNIELKRPTKLGTRPGTMSSVGSSHVITSPMVGTADAGGDDQV